jgi:hypothetical protein
MIYLITARNKRGMLYYALPQLLMMPYYPEQATRFDSGEQALAIMPAYQEAYQGLHDWEIVVLVTRSDNFPIPA